MDAIAILIALMLFVVVTAVVGLMFYVLFKYAGILLIGGIAAHLIGKFKKK